MNKSKKAQAQIITTVLIILLVLAAIIIIWQVVKNVIGEGAGSIEGGTVCITSMDQLEIDKVESCYEDISNPKIVNVKVDRKFKNINISEFIIIVSSKGISENFEIEDGASSGDVMMYGNPFSDLEIPDQGESKTYEITTNSLTSIDYLEIATIIGNEICNPIEKVEISAC